MEELLKSLQELLAIESVARRDQEKPFGNGVAQALDYTLSLCQHVWAFIQRTPTGCTAMRKSARVRRSSAALAIWTWSPREMAGIIRLMPEP
jgi:hypothetical protein